MVLRELQVLLGRLYDVPVEYDIHEFLITDRERASTVMGAALSAADEHALVADVDDGPRLSVYIDAAVLARLVQYNPLEMLDGRNLVDFCTAFEGVSHFQYLAWCLQRGRVVSLLELELQAEIDKYVIALLLRMSQAQGRFPQDLHASLFLHIGFLAELDEESLRRYREASRCAAYFCRCLDERYWRARRQRPEAWLAELRRLYRCGHHEKLRRAAAMG